MGVKLNISSYRQIAIAMTRKYLKGEGFVEDREDKEGLEDGDEEEQSGQRDSAFDLQSGHGSYMGGDGKGWGEKGVIYVAGRVFGRHCRRWSARHDGGGHPVDRVAGRFEATIRRDGDRICRMGVSAAT